MRRRDRPRPSALAGTIAALGVAIVLGSLAPATSSAFTASITNSTDTAATKAMFTCGDTFAGDSRRTSAFFQFALNEAADSTTASDSSDQHDDGTYGGSNAKDTASPTACPADRGGAYLLDGSTSRITTRGHFPPITTSFSEEVWFKTTSPGKLLGFESSPDDTSDHYDKHLYVGASGHLIFGTYNGGTQTVTSPGVVNDGAWHHAVGTTSSDGMILYLDGRQVASNPSYTTAEWFDGYWRIGQGRLDGWPDQPGSNWFTGSLRFAAAYPFVLTAQEVASEASIGAPGAASVRGMATTETRQAPATVSSASAASSDPSASSSASSAAASSPAASASSSTASPSSSAPSASTSSSRASQSDQTLQTDPSSPDVIVSSQ